MHYKLCRLSLKIFFKIFCGLEVAGAENFPPAGTPFLFCSNHDTYFDPPVLAAACPHEIGFMAKEELFKNKLFGALIASLGAIPLKRGANDMRATRLALKILKEKPLVVFPQGTRGRSLDEFSVGVGFLARKAAVPVVAAHIHGADKILPKGKKIFRPGKIKVAIGKVDNINREDDYAAIAAKIMARIKNL